MKLLHVLRSMSLYKVKTQYLLTIFTYKLQKPHMCDLSFACPSPVKKSAFRKGSKIMKRGGGPKKGGKKTNKNIVLTDLPCVATGLCNVRDSIK